MALWTVWYTCYCQWAPVAHWYTIQELKIHPGPVGAMLLIGFTGGSSPIPMPLVEDDVRDKMSRRRDPNYTASKENIPRSD